MSIKLPNDASVGEFIWVNHQQWSGFTVSDYYKPISQQTSAIWMCCTIWISTLDTSFSYFLFPAKSSWFTPKHKQQVEREKRRINWKSTGRGHGLGNCHSGSVFFPSEWHFIGTDPTFTGVSGTICATDLLQHLVRGPWLAILSNALGHGLQPSFKGKSEKELKAIHPNIPHPSGGLNKINVLLLHTKNRQEAECCMNTHSLQLHVMFKIVGPHLSWWKSGKPSWAVWMSASWRQAPSTAALSAFCLSTRWSTESTQPEPRAWQRIK